MSAPLEATMFAIIPECPAIGDMQPKVWTHVSVVPWVQLGEFRREALADMQAVFDRHGPVPLEPGPMMTVGAEGFEKRAQEIKSPGLKELHKKLLGSLAGFGLVFHDTAWTWNNYRPHITHDVPRLCGTAVIDTIHVIDNQQLRPDEKGTKLITAVLRVESREDTA